MWFWPLMLLLASIVAGVIGWVVLLAGVMQPAPSNKFRLDWTLLAWLLPAGAIGIVAAVIWLLVVLVRWLA